MKVGVLLSSRFEDPGEFLADARAMEAAGVDSVWIEDDETGIDVWMALAAVAAVTGQLRAHLIITRAMTPTFEHRRQVTTLEHLSQGRATVAVEDTHGLLTGIERWRRVEVPSDREAWANTLKQAGSDVEGVLVPMNPRLLDILRHPEDAIDRSDLLLAQG